jgi:hypothetical protein
MGQQPRVKFSTREMRYFWPWNEDTVTPNAAGQIQQPPSGDQRHRKASYFITYGASPRALSRSPRPHLRVTQAVYRFPSTTKSKVLLTALRLALDHVPRAARGPSGRNHRTDEIRRRHRCARPTKHSTVSAFPEGSAESAARDDEQRYFSRKRAFPLMLRCTSSDLRSARARNDRSKSHN